MLKGYVDADYVLELFNEESMSNIRLNFYAAGSGSGILENSNNMNVNHKGWVSHDTLETAYKNASAFISIAEKEGEQISSKIFEYMAFGKPILHIYYNEHDKNIKYLSNYPLALCIKAGKEKIEYNRTLIKLFLKARVGQEVSVMSTCSKLENCTPDYIASIIAEQISK